MTVFCTGPGEGGLGRTPAVGILSYVTTTTGTASGGLQHQSSVHFSGNQSVGPTAAISTLSATARTSGEQQQKNSEAKKAGPRNVSFGTAHEESCAYSAESRAKFALLSKRKMSLPNAVRMNTPDSADSSRRLSRLKSLKI